VAEVVLLTRMVRVLVMEHTAALVKVTVTEMVQGPVEDLIRWRQPSSPGSP
jgi:lactate dehydrogenase-like 2-hydroxyacid dehydrogenase